MDQPNSNQMNSQIQPTDEYTTPPSIVQVHLAQSITTTPYIYFFLQRQLSAL